MGAIAAAADELSIAGKKVTGAGDDKIAILMRDTIQYSIRSRGCGEGQGS
jgi:hypothetical protein